MRAVWAVAGKEILDLARDRRALILGFLLPVLAVPGLSALVEAGASRRVESPARVAVVSSGDVRGLLRHAGGLLEAVTVPDPEEALRAGRVDAVLAVPADLEAEAERGTAEVVLRYRRGDPDGLLAREKVAQVVARYSLPLVDRALRSRGLDRESLTPVRLREETVPGGAGWTGLALPLFVVVWGFAGAALVAADLTAGEKERGTWDLLRSTPASRGSLVVGKFLTCWMAGTVLAGLGAASELVFSAASIPGWPQVFGLVAAAASASSVAAVCALTVGLLSKSAREANQWALPLYLGALATAAGAEALRGWPAAPWVPVLNAFLLAQQAVEGKPQPGWGWITVLSSASVVVVLLWAAARLVDRD